MQSYEDHPVRARAPRLCANRGMWRAHRRSRGRVLLLGFGALLLAFGQVAQADDIFRKRARPTKAEPWTLYRGTKRPDPADASKVIITLADSSVIGLPKDQIVATEPERSPQEAIREANSALVKGDFERAHRLFWAVRQSPSYATNAAVLLGLSKVALLSDDAARAETLARLGVRLHGTDPLLWIQLGRAQSRLGQYVKAANTIQQAKKLDPLSSGVQREANIALAENSAARRRGGPAARPVQLPGQFDYMGNFREAGTFAAELLRWAREASATAFKTANLDLEPFERKAKALDDKGDAASLAALRAGVTRVTFRCVVDGRAWDALVSAKDPENPTDRERRDQRVTLLGFHYQIRRHYPNLRHDAVSVRVVEENKVQSKRKYVLRATALWKGDLRTGRVELKFYDPKTRR